jgi:hypothetical protein
LSSSNRSIGRGSDEYLDYLEGFLRASNERELLDFEYCAKRYLPTQAQELPLEKRPVLEGSSILSRSGMRVGISSANASDNWTSAKLRGGVVVNFTARLSVPSGSEKRITVGDDSLQHQMGSSLVAARLTRTENPAKLVLSSLDRLSGGTKLI